jgi:hypothetical protein
MGPRFRPPLLLPLRCYANKSTLRLRGGSITFCSIKLGSSLSESDSSECVSLLSKSLANLDWTWDRSPNIESLVCLCTPLSFPSSTSSFSLPSTSLTSSSCPSLSDQLFKFERAILFLFC